MFRLKLGNESGIALIVALIVSVLGTVLAGSYMIVVISESRNSVWQKHRVQSLFLAEAGIEKGLHLLNNRYEEGNPWVDENAMILATPLEYGGALADGNYEIKVYGQLEMPFLPTNSYLVKSKATMPRIRSASIKRGVSCIVSKLDPIEILAAVSIFDYADLEPELVKFESNQWTIDGRDMDALGGVMGIAVANESDDLGNQVGNRLDQVTGSNEYNDYLEGVDAILEDPKMPKTLDPYLSYFQRIAIDVSGMGSIPSSLLGSVDNFQVLYADLKEGPLKIAGTESGSGILILEGAGEFTMAGGSEWNGVIICTGDSNVLLKGGGATPAHIYGALLVANGIVETNGTADVRYSSENVAKLNAQLLLYQVYAWCGGWGVPIGEPGSQYYFPPEASPTT